MAKAKRVEQATTAATTTANDNVALVPVTVDGWTLFDDIEGGHWIRDLDLAERAELADRHDIRVTIRKCIKDGSLQWDPAGDPIARAAARCEPPIIDRGTHDDESPGFIGPDADRSNKSPGFIGARAACANNRPALVRAVKVIVTSGKGRTQDVVEFYVNEEGALVLMGRLRTPAAIAATKQVVAVFLAVARGEYARPSTALQNQDTVLAAIEGMRAELATLRQSGALVVNGCIGEDGAARIAKRQAEVVAATKLTTGELDQALRGILQFGGTGTEWAMLSPEKESIAMVVCGVFEHVMATAKKRKPRKGFDVALRFKGKGPMPEQLVMALATFVKEAA
jgi:hypothetical protein